MRQTKDFVRSLRRLGFLALMVGCFAAVYAQQNTVKGKVSDEFGEAIIGANVIEKGTTNGTITDVDGNYTLTVGNLSDAVLHVSFVGYNTKEVAVKGQSSVNLSLEPSVVNLGEVVAIGYGTQTRREITGSVANVAEENFNKGITRDAADLLQGKVAGLTITSGSGDVTRGSQIRLRGTSTLQNDQGPMIVIDGIPGGDLSTVSPSDIESISVLKDASSQAIYGSRAAGGVILITTKRGSGSRTQITYDGYVSADVVANKPDLLNAAEWLALNEELAKDPAYGIEIDKVRARDAYGADTDWFGEMLRTGFTQNHSVSLSGGGSKNNYRASYTYLDRSGVARDNYIKRHNFRFQFQQRAINDHLRVGLTASAVLGNARSPYVVPTQDNRPPSRRDYSIAYELPPVYPVYNSDGTFSSVPTDDGRYEPGNPVKNQEYNYNKRKLGYFYGAGDLQFDFTKDFNTQVRLYKSQFTNDHSQWQSPEAYNGYDVNVAGGATRDNSTYNRDVLEWTFNFNKEFGQNKVDAIAGYSWEDNLSQSQSATVTNFSVTSMGADNLQVGSTIKPGDVTSGKSEYKLISFYARAHYSFAERYMLTATVRRDGSSKFGANHKWGTFPSVSAAWGISQEDFAKDSEWLNDLKLRVGYGITGNQDGLQPYKTLEIFEASGTYYNNGALLTAFKLSQNANPDLKWEQTGMFNIGVDFSLFKDRLSGTIEWYDKRTTDMIYRYAMPTPTYVYDYMYANLGDMKNTGIEVLLNLDVVRNKEFKYTTSVNLAHNKNEVTALNTELYPTNQFLVGDPWFRGASGETSHIIKVGYPVGQFYMKTVDKDQPLTAEGKFNIVDVNKDGKITDDDRTYVGSAQPDLTFGWNNTFNWRNWDAGFFIRGSIGNDALNLPMAAYGNAVNMGTSGLYNVIDNKYLKTLKEASILCDFYVEDASFARLDNMSIGYTFNTKKLNWLDRARIYVAAQNLFVITKYTGLDPELETYRNNATDNDAGLSPGIESRDYFPKSRSFTFGVNLTF